MHTRIAQLIAAASLSDGMTLADDPDAPFITRLPGNNTTDDDVSLF